MEICETLTANSPDEALGVVSAVVISNDDMSTTLEVTVAWTYADARVSPVWSSGTRVPAACEQGNHTNVLFFIVNVTLTQMYEVRFL